MKTSRSSLVVRILATFTAAVVSLSIERAARADEPEAPPSEALAPLAEPPPPPLPSAEPATAAPPAPAPATAAPATTTGDRDVADDTSPSYALAPWDVDVRAGLHTTPILEYGGVGASVDAGMRRLGPGTLALGGGMDYLFCGTTCTSAPLSFSQKQLSFDARASWHVRVPKMTRIDLYPMITAGLMVSRSSVTVGNSEYRASDVAPSVGFGAGASYFFTDRIFAGAEARFRYSAGSYTYELASGAPKAFDRSNVTAWNASTVDLAVAVGTRF
jgi:hypothetical protein